MAKGTSIKDALKLWEEKNNAIAIEAEVMELQFQWPPIEKMDNTLSTLVNCQKLSLSTNMIDTIVGLNGMQNLKILSLARNNIKSLSGLEMLADTLEQLWISYNIIDKMKGIEGLKKLQVLYIGNNNFKNLNDVNQLNALPMLNDLVFVGNPSMESMDVDNYRAEVCKMLKRLRILDGIPILRADEDE